EPEIDFILTIGEKRIPVEVKYHRRIDPHRGTLGLRSFLEQTHCNAPFAVLVTMLEDVEVPDPRIVPGSLRSLLLARRGHPPSYLRPVFAPSVWPSADRLRIDQLR